MAKGKYTDWTTEEGLIKLEGFARDGLTDEQIAERMGIGRRTLYEWKSKYPHISHALKRGKDIVDRQVENALLKRALGYTYTEITRERLSSDGLQKKRHKGDIELTEREWEFAIKYFDESCCYCGSHKSLTKDHIIPLAKGGKFTRKNIIPCCQSCNSKKKDHNLEDWYRNMPFYNEYKMKKIQDFSRLVENLDEYENNTIQDLTVTKEVIKEVIPDVTAQIFWLKNRKPEEWRDKQNLEISRIEEEKSKLEGILQTLKDNDDDRGETID